MVYLRIPPGLIVLVLVLLCITVTAEGSVKIVPIGDSIVRGSSNDDGASHATFRYWLWKHLQESGYDVDFVGSTDQPHLPYDFDQDHEGHSGLRTSDLLTDDRLENWLSGYSPDIALVHVGTNDVMTGVPAETTISSLDEAIGILRQKNPDIVILIGTVIPRDGYIERQQSLNRAMKSLAERKNTAASPVVAVDLFSGYDCQADSQPSIYLHPNDKGDRKIADRYYAALVPYLSGERKSGSTMPTGVPTTVTPASEPAGTQQTLPEPTQNPEPQATTFPSPVPAPVTATIPAETVQTRTPAPATVSLTVASEAWSPFGGSSKQYLIGDQQAFPSPASTGWQSGSTAFGSTDLKSWKNENQYQQSSEPPAEFFIRWYPERERGSQFS
ncbi:GDSL-type esterase/lipase family protein [Methanosphaerula subterraneus]|uniref:SGNH/GDSL hydrolase family protein n=1 Tax=Methanosphaerula subterraneus TaxID=3350244 RepID=UPI003F870E2C